MRYKQQDTQYYLTLCQLWEKAHDDYDREAIIKIGLRIHAAKANVPKSMYKYSNITWLRKIKIETKYKGN